MPIVYKNNVWLTVDLPLAMSLRIFHIEDDPLAADTVERLVRHWPEYEYLGYEVSGGRGIIRCRELGPDIVLLDLSLPDVDGMVVFDALRSMPHGPRILLLTVRTDDAVLYRFAQRQATGVVLKSAALHTELRMALESCARGQIFLTPTVRHLVAQFRSDPMSFHKRLSDREISLLPHLATGNADEIIAREFGLASATVHAHRQNIMAKLNLHTTAVLMRWCAERGFAHFPRMSRAAPRDNVVASPK